MAGIENIQQVLGGVIDGINASQKLVSADYKALLKEAIDLDEAELKTLAEQVKDLDLTNDKLEATIEAIVGEGHKYVILLIRLIGLFK